MDLHVVIVLILYLVPFSFESQQGYRNFDAYMVCLKDESEASIFHTSYSNARQTWINSRELLTAVTKMQVPLPRGHAVTLHWNPVAVFNLTCSAKHPTNPDQD